MNNNSQLKFPHTYTYIHLNIHALSHTIYICTIMLFFFIGLRALEIKKWNSQIVFAKHYRRRLAYRVLVKLKKEKLDAVHRKVDAFIQSATKIQSLYRGMRGRVRYMDCVKEKRGNQMTRQVFNKDFLY